MSRSQWLERFFHNYNARFGETEQNHFLKNMAKRLGALSRIQKITSQHVKSLLQSRKHSSAGRMLICQLLVDLETSLSTFTSGSGTSHNQADPLHVSDQRHLAALLYENGDFHGALTLLHRVPHAQIGGTDLKRMMKFGVDLCSRMKRLSKVLGIYDDLMVLDRNIFGNLAPLVLPYSLLAERSNYWIDDEAFIKKSFIWPWIRISVLKQLQDQPGAPVNWTPTELDPDLQDAFGHTFLHAAILCQDNDRSMAIIENFLEPRHVYLRQHLVTKSPSYAPGLTPLACSACSASFLPVAHWGVFQAVLSLSDKYLCCARPENGSITHEFCALSIAVRNHDFAAVNALLKTSTQQIVDISNCCRWTWDCNPTIWMRPDICELLAQMLKQPVAGSEEDGDV